MKKATGLGRGLSALIGEAPGAARAQSGGGVRTIEVARIRPNPSQPRQRFDDESLNERAASIAERGVLQPIIVREVEGGYELVAGERRWRAAQKAQLHEIPAIIREFDDESSAEVALIENIQRENLNAIEEAEAYRQLIERYSHSQEVIAKLVGKSRSHIPSRRLRIRRILPTRSSRVTCRCGRPSIWREWNGRDRVRTSAELPPAPPSARSMPISRPWSGSWATCSACGSRSRITRAADRWRCTTARSTSSTSSASD